MNAMLKDILIMFVAVLAALVVFELGKKFVLKMSFEEALENELEKAAGLKVAA